MNVIPPFDGHRILAEAKEFAFPRAAGSKGDVRAIELVADRFRDAGADTRVEWFAYDLGPAQRSLRSVLIVGALLSCAAGFAMSRSPVLSLFLLLAAVLPGLFFLAWSPRIERLYQRDGALRTANVVGRWRRGSPTLRLVLMAHHDSKSQNLSLPLRVGATVVALSGLASLGVLAVAALVKDADPGPPWLAAATGAVTAAAAVALAALRSGDLSPGGVDNAGSMAVLLAVARRLRGNLPDHIELVALSTGAEEDHMVGALRWLDRHRNALSERPTWSVNLDGAGAPGRPVLIERYGFGRRFSPALSAAARRAAARLELRPRAILMLPGVGIDAIPFAHRGIPCLTLASGSLGRATMSVHSANDHADHLDPKALQDVANLAYETLLDLGGVERDRTEEPE